MEIPYIVVHCKRGHRTQFPQETSESPFEHLADPSKGALSIAVSCGVCKRVENHTIEKRATHIGTEDTVEYQTRRAAYGFVRKLRCAETGCPFPLTVIAPRNAAMTREEQEVDVSTWEWDELRCPKGHLIPKPERK